MVHHGLRNHGACHAKNGRCYHRNTLVIVYHEYKDLWTVHLGQSLATKAVTTNLLDRSAVAVLLDVVRHLPKGNLGDVRR